MARTLNHTKHLCTLASQSNFHRPRLLPFDYGLSTFGMLLSFLILSFQSCGLDIEDPTPPSPPVWVQKSLPEVWPERGIDAHESGGIYLEWESNPEEDIAGYSIYRARWDDEAGNVNQYIAIATIKVDSETDLIYLDNEASEKQIYYYKLRSVDVSGNLSQFSESLKYELLPALSINTMMPNGSTDSLNEDRTLSWVFEMEVDLVDNCITVLSSDNQLVTRVIVQPYDYTGGREYWTLPTSLMLIPNRIYKWRIDANANYNSESLENSGSESNWATFLYVDL